MRQAFSTNDHKLKIKGCWFHFCQAILKQVEKKLTKNQDAITCNLFQKLKNNTLLKPTHRSSNTFDNLGNALVSLLALSSKNSWVDIMYNLFFTVVFLCKIHFCEWLSKIF